MKITIFSEELRECLDAAGLSDCGENDTWNYWYQRLMNAYNESVERQIMTEQAENAKLRELVRDAWGDGHPDRSCEGCDIRDEYPNAESIDDIDPDDFNDALKSHEN